MCTDTYIKPISVWWSDLRLDYMLETPCKDGFEMLPDAAMVRIFHSRYWEAKELVSFILRQVITEWHTRNLSCLVIDCLE